MIYEAENSAVLEGIDVENVQDLRVEIGKKFGWNMIVAQGQIVESVRKLKSSFKEVHGDL